MISTNEVVSKDVIHANSSSNSSPASSNNNQNSFRNQKMIKQFAQTLIFIVLIFVASFFRDVIKQEKIRKKERAEMASQIAHQNYLLEQERFLVKHREFLATFLQYEDRCNKIHALLYKNPCGMTKVKFNCKNCGKGSTRNSKVRIQMGDRTPLDFALIYVFLASLMFLLIRAIIDVSKEFNAPSQDSVPDEKTSSLHDYATRRCSNISNASNSATPQKKRDSKVLQPRITTTSSGQQGTTGDGNTECTTSGIALNETSCITGKLDRRSSVPATMGHNQYLLKDTIDFRRQSFEALNEEDENCSPETKKHRLIRR